HGLHAGRLLRRAQVDRDDAGMRMRRAEDLAPELPGPADVVRVLRRPGDLDRTVEAWDPLAQENRLVRPGILLVALGSGRRGDYGDLAHLSHATPPSCSARPGAPGDRCRTGRCCRRAPRGPAPESVTGSTRAARRPTSRIPACRSRT